MPCPQLRPIVLESTEDEAAAMSMTELGVMGDSLDSAAGLSKYCFVDRTFFSGSPIKQNHGANEKRWTLM
ncbi:hypothetical protein PF001_g10599 [Phytophthora fragariae]|uniref:Uncharacterized protein n=1 Tax=Phytophthora fragariae TaxID=53985 RepID=A0A6A4DQK1_9STRA|nr:hypothetical protein PF004_g18346 [Phytophthora fragariae]KAE9309611.1 hypothetical protein PF001_g10599 [Phytophthora fragariae]KAE9329370.1 hypothetical protein PF008_g15960 [Phytophthora fragariae]